MSDGVVAQAGPPYTLLTEQEGGMFSQMVAETGSEMRDKLLEMARQKYEEKTTETFSAQQSYL